MNCKYCGTVLNKTTSEINRAKKLDSKLYCNRECAGLGRRKDKTTEQLKEEKKEYDRLYRLKNKSKIKERGVKYNQTEAGRATQKRNRDKRKIKHLKYCQKPEYVKYKKEYDKKHRAQLNYGEFWESSILINKIKEEIPNFEIKQQNGLLNKSQKRKRDYDKSRR